MADVEKTGTEAVEAHDETFEFEHQEPKTNLIALLLVASCVVLVVIIVFLQWFYSFTRDLKVSAAENVKFEPLEKLRADEDDRLKSYRYVDKEKGIVQIPVERAMQLIAEEAKGGQPKYAQEIKPMPAPSAAPTAAAAPAPAKAAEGAKPAEAMHDESKPAAAGGGKKQ